VPEWLAAAPEMPQLVHAYLAQATQGSMELRVVSDDLKQLAARTRHNQRLLAALCVLVALSALSVCLVLALR